MTVLLYILIAALAFFVIGYLLAKAGCVPNEGRYLEETPVDPVTTDDGNCEDEKILQTKKDNMDTGASKIAVSQHKEEETKTKIETSAKTEITDKSAKEEAEEKSVKKESSKKSKTKTSTKEDKAVKTEKKAAPTADEEDAGVAPLGLLSAPRGGKKDNLTKIKGIGIKIDKALNEIGIYHFDQIAAWTEDNMKWADSELAFPGRAKRDNWVGQAKLLAEGKETEFSKRVEKGEVASSKKA